MGVDFFATWERSIISVVVIIILMLILYQLIFWIYTMIKSYLYSFEGKHVLITGGSSGLGLCVAKDIAKQGGKITIIARREEVLKRARTEIINSVDNIDISSRVQYFSADVTKEQSIRDAITKSEDKFGPIDILISSHGASLPKYAFETNMKESRSMMELNYFGTVHLMRAVLPGMMKRNNGEIVIVTSQLALCGFVGYAHYSASKYATRGFVEVLRNELAGYNITIRLAYPPGMVTPGYEVENQTKPAECKEIESGETAYQPELCAAALIGSIKKNEKHISCGDFGCNLLARGCVGMSDRNNTLADSMLLWILPLAFRFYTHMWNAVTKDIKYQKNREILFSGLEPES